MTQYIDKDEVIAEINRIEKELLYEIFTDEYLGKRWFCNHLKYFLDNLEVKDVDLEKEYKSFVEEDPVYTNLVNGIVGKAIAKHFFELGLKTQKGE